MIKISGCQTAYLVGSAWGFSIGVGFCILLFGITMAIKGFKELRQRAKK